MVISKNSSTLQAICLVLCIGFALTQQQKSRGLLANILGKHPQGIPSSSNLQEGRQSQFCCCLRSGSICPNAGEFDGRDYDYGDEDYEGAILPRADRVNNEKVSVRIVNAGESDNKSPEGCSNGRRPCCYKSAREVLSVSNTCTILPGGGGGSSVPWTQGCFGNSPRQSTGKKCGERSFSPLNQLGRGEASPQEFPWACMLLDGQNRFIGTCAIIPETFSNDISRGTTKVVTAAHKLDAIGQFDQLKVRVNEYNANDFISPPEISRHEEYTVVKFTVHPQYRPKRFINDLAVLVVDRPINLVSHDGVNAACLPHCPEMFDYKFPNGTGTRCWTAGWGKDKVNGNFQPIIHKVDLPIYDQSRCESALRNELSRKNHAAGQRLRLHESELCAGGEAGKDACDGDGGAPLVCQALTGQYYVVGLVTWGVDCALQDVPGVYARISHFRDFIENPES
ncbi:hypothetical protein TCAL_03143 [Tigriopus californicus]|uniref:Peptidase S1 domain-containing protein n=1 Tax=Tigriopus californicus TaxID=6832 RepID=A0A553P3H1_TIGCA|nr:phenoloxidase-activating factor 2-like [Tigriopus californicus]TRY72248.1 hypothetical protein TCAL_03143 [Tigriopus californicus]